MLQSVGVHAQDLDTHKHEAQNMMAVKIKLYQQRTRKQQVKQPRHRQLQKRKKQGDDRSANA